MLTQDEEVVFILADIGDHVTLEHAQQLLVDNRAYIAWARLPAAILLPAHLADEQDALRTSGVMGTMFLKPLAHADLVDHIRHSLAL